MKLTKFKIITLLILILIIFLSIFFLVDVGVNSKYFIRKNFNEAFQYRLSGDCVAFSEFMHIDTGGWEKRCEEEKSREKEPIRSYEIKTVTHKFGSDKAFVQAELVRNIKLKEEYEYSASYEMKKIGYKWKILNEIK